MEKAEATVQDDDFRAMLERIRQKAAQHKNVVVLPPLPEDGIICPGATTPDGLKSPKTDTPIWLIVRHATNKDR